MSEIFITKLALSGIRNIDYLEIPLSEDKMKHLILTGKNGSGKTTVLNYLSDILNKLVSMDASCAAEKKAVISFNYSENEIKSLFEQGKYVIAYYKANRVFEADIPKYVEKVELKQNYAVNDAPRKDLVKYLLDLKVTQALSAASGKNDKAQKIEEWFQNFEKLLQRIFANQHHRYLG